MAGQHCQTTSSLFPTTGPLKPPASKLLEELHPLVKRVRTHLHDAAKLPEPESRALGSAVTHPARTRRSGCPSPSRPACLKVWGQSVCKSRGTLRKRHAAGCTVGIAANRAFVRCRRTSVPLLQTACPRAGIASAFPAKANRPGNVRAVRQENKRWCGSRWLWQRHDFPK